MKWLERGPLSPREAMALERADSAVRRSGCPQFIIPTAGDFWLNSPMQSMNKTKVTCFGAGFIADIHLESYHRLVPEAEIVAVYARNPQKAEAFATKHKLARWFTDLEKAITESGLRRGGCILPNFLIAP